MTPSFSQSIRLHADAYAQGRTSLDDFKDWLIGATWNVERDDPEAAHLTYDIKLLLAEHSNGDLSVSELRDQIRPILASLSAPVGS